MNRRKAIYSISLAGAGLITAFSGYKWYNISKAPDLDYLEKNAALLAALAETIIPATDTPGAKEAEVHFFIVKMIKDCTDIKTQNNFIDGLKDIQNYCLREYNLLYQDCPLSNQQTALKKFETESRPFNYVTGKVRGMLLGKPFFTTLKEYTVEGYCTSRQGATQGLSYLPVPGRFEGCIALSSGQKAWATN